jgi:hypothetical protein
MKKFFHKIHVWLYKNLLTADPDDYSGRTKVERVLSTAEVSYLAETRGGSDIKADDLTRAVNIWFKEMSYQLCDDNAVNTGYFQAKLHVHGAFKSATDSFDPKRHKLSFEFQQGKLLRDELSLVEAVVDGVADTAPFIDTVFDYGSETTNLVLTPGGMLDIKGFHLKFLPGEANNGIFLMPVAGGEEMKLAPVPTNMPTHLLTQTPAGLADGDYWMEVRTTFNGSGGALKTLKVGRLSQVLSVSSITADNTEATQSDETLNPQGGGTLNP